MAHHAMTRFRCAVSALAITLAATTVAPSLAQDAAFPAPQDFSVMAQAKLPAVVGIIATGPDRGALPGPRPRLPPGLEDFFDLPRPDGRPPMPQQALGSGFFISKDGYVVTNNHVIAGASEIQVVAEDDRRLDARLVGTDPATDIALLKVEGRDFPAVTWGASRDLEIGEWVVAIGNPFGLGGTVTAGIVSARSRNINAGPYDDFIQTDAAINRGNSGGPLFNAEGRVVGVNTAIFSPSGGNVGIGFAVPAHVAARIVADLRDDGAVSRGWLGVRIQPVSETIADAVGLDETNGAMINEVTEGSPAAEAGMRAGDVVISVNGEAIEGPRDLVFSVANLAIDETAILTVWRDGDRVDVPVRIAQQPGQMASAAQPMPDTDSDGPRLGVTVSELTPELRAQFNLPQSLGGLAIVGVAPDSAAARAGLARGDVIVAAAGETVRDTAMLRLALEAAWDDDRPVLLRIFRGGVYQFVAVPPDASSDG